MKRLDKRDFVILCAAGVLFASAVLLYTRFEYAFGSTLDWESQHYAIPDMMRKLFYDTGEFFPSLAPNLGAGENIYAFSYYGLYSPVILFSYLLPFVSMAAYIQAASAVLCFAGGALFYRFMRKRQGRAVSAALMTAYLSAGPIFLHSHRHIMFVSFLPFLILGFEAVDNFFEGRRKWQVTLCAFLIIMTNWFFSVSALAALTVYAVSRYLAVTEKVTLGSFARAAGDYALRIIAAVMSAGVLLLPTVKVLLSGRDETNISFSLSEFIPYPRLGLFAFSISSLGLGCAGLFAIACAAVSKERSRRFLGIVLALLISCPALVWLLNGTMYIDGKVLIPFIPIALMLCGEVFSDLKEGRKLLLPLILTAAALTAALLLSDTEVFFKKLIGIDAGVLAAAGLLLAVFKERRGAIAALLIVPLCSAFYINYRDSLIGRDIITKLNSPACEKLGEHIGRGGDCLRASFAEHRLLTANLVTSQAHRSPYIYSSLHSRLYNELYLHEMNNENELRNPALTVRSQNPMFECFVSNGWLFSDSPEPPFGYGVYAEEEGVYLHRSSFALPLGRVKQPLGEDVFEGLNDAEKMEALVRYAVTGSGGSFEGSCTDLGELVLPESGYLTPKAEGYSVRADRSFSLLLDTGFEVSRDRLLVLEIPCSGNSGDVWLRINGVTNLLTDPTWKYRNNNGLFTYVIAPKTATLALTFSDGEYELGKLRAYAIDAPKDVPLLGRLDVDADSTRGDFIAGTLSCTEDGVFELAVPYSEGFEVSVDGEKTEYRTVGKAFLGFDVSRGEHRVEIRFTAPGLRAGQIMSLAGIALAVLTELLSRRKKRP